MLMMAKLVNITTLLRWGLWQHSDQKPTKTWLQVEGLKLPRRERLGQNVGIL